MKIGEKIKLLRQRKGMSLRELARKSGYSASFISQIERERTTPSLPSLENIAKALEYPIKIFFDEDEDALLENYPHGAEEPDLNRILFHLLESKISLLRLFKDNVGIVNSADNIAINLGGNIDRVKFDLEDMVRAKIVKKLSTSDTTLFLFQPGSDVLRMVESIIRKLEGASDEA